MPTTYIIAIDYDDDGDFTDTGEDITADVLALRWRLGFATPDDSLAAPISARITVRSPNRAYSPEYTANDLSPGKPIRIQSNDGATTRTHFTGFIQHVEPLPGAQGERLAVIHAGGPEHELAANHLRLPPQVNRRADQVIAAVLDALPLRQTKLKGYWLLGVANHSELDTNTRLREDYPRSLEAGKSTFAYTADTWGDGIPAAAAIRQMAESERGRFFVNRAGQLIFYNRHHTLADTTVDATFSNNIDGLDYDYGGAVVNQVEVSALPRSIGAAGTVLWTLEASQKIEPGEGGVRRIIARFRDADERPVGALSLKALIAGTDYQANTLPDGSGQDRTAQISLVVEAAASAAALTLRNNAAETVYLLAGAQLKGTPLQPGDPLTLEQTDWTSVSLHGLSRLSLNLPALGALDEADQLARYELSRRKDPRGLVRHIQVSNPLHLTQILARTLFDRITVTETQTDHSADYFIIAEEHEVDLGSVRHRAVWLLESAASAFWVVGIGKLDETTTLAY